MIVDASVIVAILREEPETHAMLEALHRTQSRLISAVNYVEAAIIADRNSEPILSRRLNQLLSDAEIHITPVTATQAEIARAAYRDFGKGRHKAGLNLGDCFAYALAIEMREALLFKGSDFQHTDVKVAELL
jgi:ribonuclease VapC